MSENIKKVLELLQMIDEVGNLVSDIDDVIRACPQELQEFLYGKLDEKLNEAFGNTINDEALFGDLDPDRIVN